ncbi:IS3 family transposase [Candidatus Accumulibacter sp. ACC003]|uniref:IS3 family transposase n=1 Tax=Candidatus Accumulibacter sp. ACC003 TaxID=2823334 RepID=UPI00344C96F7
MSHRLIDQLAEKATTGVAPLCRLLGVSRSGYYAAAARARKPASVCAATVHLKTAFTASGRSYGSRRLQQAMVQEGRPIGRHRVRTLMRINGLRPIWKRKCKYSANP